MRFVIDRLFLVASLIIISPIVVIAVVALAAGYIFYLIKSLFVRQGRA